jgi:Abortive infection alpha
MTDELPQIAKLASDAAPDVREALESSGLFAVLREGIGPVEDRLALRRETRWLEMVAEVVEFWKARDVPAAAIRDKTLRAVYEYASLEEDPDMAQLWVKLLAGALGGTEIPPAFPEILQQLEPIEARFLDAVAISAKRHLPQPGLYLEHMQEVQPLLDSLEWRHLDNLERLQLLVYEFGGPANLEPPPRPRDRALSVSVAATHLGRALIRACSE